MQAPDSPPANFILRKFIFFPQFQDPKRQNPYMLITIFNVVKNTEHFRNRNDRKKKPLLEKIFWNKQVAVYMLN